MTGIIARIVPKKMFGFISSNDKDYFFHRDDYFGPWIELENEFQRGDFIEVTFDVVESNKGLRAGGVKKV